MSKNTCSHCGTDVADPGDIDIDSLLCEACQSLGGNAPDELPLLGINK